MSGSQTLHSAVVTVGVRAPLQVIQVPTVKPGSGEVLVRVLWTASTPLDLHQSDGGLLVTHPQVLGDTVSGEVVQVGSGVLTLQPGDKVFGFTWRSNRERGQQEFVTVPDFLLGKVPDGVSLEAAATVPNNFVTAWNMFTTDFGIELPYPKPDGYTPPSADAPILIWGAATSVGQYALQLLHYYGYTGLIATASPKHHNYLRSLGVTDILDYSDNTITERLAALLGEAKQPAKIVDCVGSVKGSVLPVSRIAKAGDVVAIMLPLIVKDATENEAPEYAMDASTISQWADGVTVCGVRTHFYLQNEFNKQHLQPVIMPELVRLGIITPNRFRIIKGTTLVERAEQSLGILRRKEASGERLIWRVSDE